MTEWYIKRGDQEVGPGTEAQLQLAFKKGAITLETLVRRADSAEWMTLKASLIVAPDEVNPFLGSEPRGEKRSSSGDEKPLIHKDMFQEKPSYRREREIRYATAVDRTVAILIDGFILMIASVVTMRLGAIGLLLQMVLGFGYFAFFQHEWGYTIGRKLMGIHVEMAGGGRPELRTFIVRYFAALLSGFILGIGYFMAVFDEKSRTLHDRVAGTVVVKD
jgi:uncharacterized RDD family membrane protein YckC